jgi:hypothetical protein
MCCPGSDKWGCGVGVRLECHDHFRLAAAEAGGSSVRPSLVCGALFAVDECGLASLETPNRTRMCSRQHRRGVNISLRSRKDVCGERV